MLTSALFGGPASCKAPLRMQHSSEQPFRATHPEPPRRAAPRATQRDLGLRSQALTPRSYGPTPRGQGASSVDLVARHEGGARAPQAGATPSPEQRRPRAVFLLDFIDVNRPLELLRTDFGDDGRWLAPLANEAQQDGTALLARIGPTWVPKRLGREVGIALGRWRARENSIAVPIRWEAIEAGRLFPILDGDLELAPLGPDRCRLILAASYIPPFGIPPFGSFGRVLDRALLHRIADSTARAFLGRLAEHLEHTVR